MRRDATENDLSGSIPTQMGLLTSLAELRLDSNSLSGTLPTELGLPTAMMEHLHLDSNSLNGPIPTELGELTSLDELRLYSNSLSGTFPTELGELTSLRELSLQTNALSGTIPTELGDLNMRSFYVHTNAGLCGPLASVGMSVYLAELGMYITQATTSYTDGIGGTSLNTACSSRMEDQLAYLACLASPSTCTTLCVSLPLPLKCF